MENKTNEILESPLKPESFFKPHHCRHIISGTFVFLFGIAADQGLHELRLRRPHSVIWAKSVDNNHVRVVRALPTNQTVIEFGVADDGTVVWKMK